MVWKYLSEAGEAHARAHSASARFLGAQELAKNVVVVTAERKIAGRWSRFVTRSTEYAPLAVVNEELEGDFAGSKFVVVYTPHGHQTRVDLFGEFRSATIPSRQVEPLVRGLFQAAYEDDVPAVREFALRALR